MKKMMILAALCLMGMAAQAQQNLSWGQGPQVASPDVHADNSVTFNLIAPRLRRCSSLATCYPRRKWSVARNISVHSAFTFGVTPVFNCV